MVGILKNGNSINKENGEAKKNEETNNPLTVDVHLDGVAEETYEDLLQTEDNIGIETKKAENEANFDSTNQLDNVENKIYESVNAKDSNATDKQGKG